MKIQKAIELLQDKYLFSYDKIEEGEYLFDFPVGGCPRDDIYIAVNNLGLKITDASIVLVVEEKSESS